MERHELKELERMALNVPNLKNYGTKGLDAKGNAKEGFFIARDSRVLKISEVTPSPKNIKVNDAQTVSTKELQELAFRTPNLKDMSSLAKKKDGSLKNGYIQLQDGKIVSIKAILAAK